MKNKFFKVLGALVLISLTVHLFDLSFKITDKTKEQSLAYDIAYDILTKEKNLENLIDLQTKIDLISPKTQLLSFFNCFYSVNCSLSNESMYSKLEVYNQQINKDLKTDRYFYVGTIALLLISVTSFLLIANAGSSKLNFESTIGDFRKLIKYPILSELNDEYEILINKEIIKNINKIPNVSRIILTENNEIILFSDSMIKNSIFSLVNNNKYILKLTNPTKKVA